MHTSKAAEASLCVVHSVMHALFQYHVSLSAVQFSHIYDDVCKMQSSLNGPNVVCCSIHNWEIDLYI